MIKNELKDPLKIFQSVFKRIIICINLRIFIRSPKVGGATIVVMTEVTAARAGVSQVVWFPLKVSVKFSCHHRASGPHVPDPQGFF